VRSTGHQGMCGHSHEGIVGSKVSSELNRRTKLGQMRRVVCIVVYCSCIVYLRVSLCIVAFHGVVYRLCMVVFRCRVWWCYHGVPWCSWFSSELNRRTKLGQTGAGFPQSLTPELNWDRWGRFVVSCTVYNGFLRADPQN
jgi:hypothetical protein